MSRSLVAIGFLAAAVATAAGTTLASDGRTLRLTYRVSIGPIEEGVGPIHVFVPLAQDDEHQTVAYELETGGLRGTERTESTYGNRFWHGSMRKSKGEPVELVVEWLRTVDEPAH